MLEAIDLLQLRDAHRPARTLEQLIGRHRALLAHAGELPKAELEDALHTGRVAACLNGAVQSPKIATGPEVVLETIGLALRTIHQHALAEDDGP